MVSMRCWMHPITTMQNHFIRTQEKQHNFQDNYIIFMIFQVLEKNTFFRNPGFSFETPSFLRGPTFSWDPEASGRYMVGGFKHFWNFPSYMGCHPSHWRTPIFFRGVGQPPTTNPGVAPVAPWRRSVWGCCSSMLWPFPARRWRRKRGCDVELAIYRKILEEMLGFIMNCHVLSCFIMIYHDLSWFTGGLCGRSMTFQCILSGDLWDEWGGQNSAQRVGFMMIFTCRTFWT